MDKRKMDKRIEKAVKKSAKKDLVAELKSTAEGLQGDGRFTDAATAWRKLAAATGERKLRIEARARAKECDMLADDPAALVAANRAREAREAQTVDSIVDEPATLAKEQSEHESVQAARPATEEEIEETYGAILMNEKAREWVSVKALCERYLYLTENLANARYAERRADVEERLEDVQSLAGGQQKLRDEKAAGKFDEPESVPETKTITKESMTTTDALLDFATSTLKRLPDTEPKGWSVESKDDRKAKIVALFKSVTKATHITHVRESAPGVFMANCSIPKREWEGEGTYQIEVPPLAREEKPATEMSQTTQISNLVAEARKHEAAGEFDRAVSVWKAVQMMAGDGTRRAIAAKKCEDLAQRKLDRKAARVKRDEERAAKRARRDADRAARRPRASKAPSGPKAPDGRLPPPGTTLQHRKGDAVLAECVVGEHGSATYKGAEYKTLTSAAMAAAKDLGIKGRKSGFVFWGLVPDFPQDKYADVISEKWSDYEEKVKTALVAVRDREAFDRFQKVVQSQADQMIDFLATLADRAGQYPPIEQPAPKSESGKEVQS